MKTYAFICKIMFTSCVGVKWGKLTNIKDLLCGPGFKDLFRSGYKMCGKSHIIIFENYKPLFG